MTCPRWMAYVNSLEECVETPSGPTPGSLWLSGLWITEFVEWTGGGHPPLDGGYTRVRVDESHPLYNADDFLFTHGDYITFVVNTDNLGIGDPPFIYDHAGWGRYSVRHPENNDLLYSPAFQDITIEQQAEGDNWLFIQDVGAELSKYLPWGNYMRLVDIWGGFVRNSPNPIGLSWTLIDVRSSKSGAPSSTASPVEVTVYRYEP